MRVGALGREREEEATAFDTKTIQPETQRLMKRDIRPAGDGKFPFFYGVFNFRQMMIFSLFVANPHFDEFPNAVAMHRRAAVQKMRHTHDGVKGR